MRVADAVPYRLLEPVASRGDHAAGNQMLAEYSGERARLADPAKRGGDLDVVLCGDLYAATSSECPAGLRAGGARSSISHCSVNAVRPITISAPQP